MNRELNSELNTVINNQTNSRISYKTTPSSGNPASDRLARGRSHVDKREVKRKEVLLPAHFSQSTSSASNHPISSYSAKRAEADRIAEEELHSIAIDQFTLQKEVFFAALQGNWQDVDLKLDFLNPNWFECEEHGHLIHIAAAQKGAEPVLRKLASFTELVNQPDWNGCTPIMIAIRNNSSIAAVKILLEAGASPMQRDCEQVKNLLQLADEAGNRPASEYLKNNPLTSIREQLKIAAKSGDKEKIRSLCAVWPVSSRQNPHSSYDHLAFIAIMDDKTRLQLVMHSYPENYRADLYLWEMDSHGNCTKEDHLISSSEIKLTANSKLVIEAHGSTLRKIGGRNFARRLDQWLSEKHHLYNETPRITFRSCSVATPAPGDSESFTRQLCKGLQEQKRTSQITASTATIWICPDGKELCGRADVMEDGVRKIKMWQGDDHWLNPKLHKKYKLQNITPDNRRTDLIKVESNSSSEITQRNKFSLQNVQGLHTMGVIS